MNKSVAETNPNWPLCFRDSEARDDVTDEENPFRNGIQDFCFIAVTFDQTQR